MKKGHRVLGVWSIKHGVFGGTANRLLAEAYDLEGVVREKVREEGKVIS